MRDRLLSTFAEIFVRAGKGRLRFEKQRTEAGCGKDRRRDPSEHRNQPAKGKVRNLMTNHIKSS
jgi:hypothetical protein